MTARWQVKALIVALALLLMLPVLFIFAQNEQELSRARNKTLARWPGIQVLVSEPERYFRSAKRRINDRVGLGITAAGLVRWVKMYAFRDDPTLHLTLSGDHLFLNAWAPDPDIRFLIFRETCRPSDDAAVAKLVRKGEAIEAYFRKYGADTAFIVVPTTPVLYADKLPATVPSHIRRKCLAALRGDSLIKDFAAQKADNVIYPLQDFIARRDVNSFYPARSFHFQGESIWLVARRYFERLGVKPSAVPKATRLVEAKSELSRQLGFALPVAINSVSLDRGGLSHRAWPNIPDFRQNFLRASGREPMSATSRTMRPSRMRRPWSCPTPSAWASEAI
jgi:hypothetical protein